MVKTRHSGGTDAESPPTFISLANEKSRQSLKSDEVPRVLPGQCRTVCYLSSVMRPSAELSSITSAGVDGQSERTYVERSDAYNIFEEKVVESRLRPRIGPSRAYNYIDVDSSDEEIIRRRHRHLPIPDYSSEHRRAGYRSSRQLKQEMLGKQDRPRQVLIRQPSPNEDTEEQSTEEEDEDNRLIRTRRQRPSGGVDEGDGDGTSNRSSSSRRRQLTLEEHEDNDNGRTVRKPRRMVEDDDEEIPRAHNLRQRPRTEDDEHLIRRSSRTRRQVYDTLNQQYLVSIPGRSRHDSGDNNDNSDAKDQDSDDNEDFSDMYSRVKRKRVQVKRNMYGVPVTDDSDSEQDIAKSNKSNNNKGEDEDEDDENCDDDGDDDAGDNMKDVGNTSERVTRQKKHSLHKKQPEIVKSYSLREHKPRTDLYKAPVEERRIKRIHGSLFVGTPTKKITNQTYQSPAQRRNIRKRSAFHSSSSSTSSGSESSNEKNFSRRKTKSMDKARSRMMPLNFNSSALPFANIVKDRVKSGASLADIEPMNIDRNVTFNSIGGLGKHIRALKEMIVFPLLYEQVFQRFKVDPPRGVLFYGPPGTGKTLVARALANECSQGSKRVAFFMRKGADCLSKWVGESERQLRLLFDQAYKYRPSIIFFDEIDGLAPVRSSRQDQIHSSIVSTLLALMDGLDNRGEIVVIGATNRIDSLDPALRRPGRFDREFLFHLPSLEARKQILTIQTAAWNPRLNDDFISELAEKCVGYCGADLKALCTEAAMLALRRRYPQIYITNEALQLDVSSINVSAKDFFDAVNNIIPTSQRAVNTPARALPARVNPLLQRLLDRVMNQLGDIFPPCLSQAASLDTAVTSSQVQALAENGIMWDEFASDEDEDAPSIYVQTTPSKGSKANRQSIEERPSTSQSSATYLNFASSATSHPATFRPRLILVGREGQGQTTYIAPAIIHKLENLPVHVLDLPTLYAVTAKTPEESCANVFHEAKRKCPSIIYMPYISQWWDVMGETLRAALLALIQNLDPSLPLLLLATSDQPYHTLDVVLQSLFSHMSGEVVHMADPNMEERRAFFQDLLLRQAIRPPSLKRQAEFLKCLKTDVRIKRSCNRSCKSRRTERSPLATYMYIENDEMDDEFIEDDSDNEASLDIPINIAALAHGRRKALSQHMLDISHSKYEIQSKVKRKLCGNNNLKAKKGHNDMFAATKKKLSQATAKNCKAIIQKKRKSTFGMTLRSQTNNAKLNSNQSARQSESRIQPVVHKSKKSAVSQKSAYKKPRISIIQVYPMTVGALRKRAVSNKNNPRLYCGTHQMLYKKCRSNQNYTQECGQQLALPLNLQDLRPETCNYRRRIRHRPSSPGKRMRIRCCSRCSLWSRQPWRRRRNAQRMLEVLPKAAPPKPKELTEEELSLLMEKEELTLMELRIFLRDVLNKLGSDKKFSIFAKPVNIEDAADYYEIIEHPMDLSTMMAKIDLHEYTTVRAFMQDIDLICSNALEYNPNRGTMDRIIRHRACALKDTAYAIIKTDLDKDFEKTCVEIGESRKRRGDKSTTVPNFYYTQPGSQQQSSKSQGGLPSYLDNSKSAGSIPKPEGERFSRRVRGMNIDPVPPLEAVEKVYKLSRVGGLTTQDQKNSPDNEPVSCSRSQLPNSSIHEEKTSHSFHRRSHTPAESSHSKDEKKVIVSDNKTEDEKKHSQSSTSLSNKKKKNKCVWCKPRRKRPRFSLVKSSIASHASGDEGVEDQLSHEDMDYDKLAHDSQNDATQQLVVDTTEPEVSTEPRDLRSPGRKSIRSRSPAHISPIANCSSRVSTRRSSLSPHAVPVTYHSPSKEPQVNADPTELNKDSEPSVQEHSLHSESSGDNTDKVVADPVESLCHQLPKALVPPPSLLMEPPFRPKVVKRLDLEPVAVDSGVGSSVDSNGDSRDSIDHRGEVEPGVRPSSLFPGAEDVNQNCNKELKNRACAVLNAPPQKVVVDNNRLLSLLNRLVARTDSYTVERLEKIYSHLSQIIFRHRQEYDKSAMVSDLAQKVDELTKIVPSTSTTSTTRTSNSITDSAA